jgi:hypothetical protein
MTNITISRKVRVGEVVKIKGKYYKVCKDNMRGACLDCAFWKWESCPPVLNCLSDIHFVKYTAPKTKPKSKVSSTQKQLEKALCAIRVIYTLATVRNGRVCDGRGMNLAHIAELTNDTLDEIVNMQEKDGK